MADRARCPHDLTPNVCGFCTGAWRLLPDLPEVGPGGRLGFHSSLFRSARQPDAEDLVPLDLEDQEEGDDA